MFPFFSISSFLVVRLLQNGFDGAFGNKQGVMFTDFFPYKITLKPQHASLGVALAKIRSDQYIKDGIFMFILN